MKSTKRATGKSTRVTNSLVALSSAAVLTVYAAGYLRTKPAADRFAVEAAERRPSAPPARTATPAATAQAAADPAALQAARVTAQAPAAPAPVAVAASSSRKISQKSPVSPAVPKAAPAAATSEMQTPATPAAATTTAAAATTTPAAVPAAPAGGAAAETPAAPPAAPQAQYKDGTYFGWGTSRHGDIQASVVIENGRIASASIAQCLTRYSCSWIAHLPPQVVSRQSPEVDYVSGATQSVNAFYYAVVEALSKAR